MTVVGTVRALHRYPLKSADGERLEQVEVGPEGLAEDRRWAVRTGSGHPVTAKQVPALRSVRARSVDGVLQVAAPGPGEPVGWTDALHVLADVVGDEVELEDAPGAHQQVAAVHVVSEGAVGAPDAPGGCDPVPRANLVLGLAEPGAERSWLGRRLGLGEVVLEVTRLPQRCLGVYCRVLRPGTVRAGDEVVLDPD
jgi:uncharacterized protein YcbX